MKTSMETTKLLALAVALLCSACQTIPTGQVLVEAGPKPTSDQAEAVIRAQLARSRAEEADRADGRGGRILGHSVWCKASGIAALG